MLCCRSLVVELKDVSRAWVWIATHAFAVMVEMVRVRVGLLAVGAVMVAAMLEVALPGGVDAAREDSTDAAG